jgi:hypothetical protein
MTHDELEKALAYITNNADENVGIRAREITKVTSGEILCSVEPFMSDLISRWIVSGLEDIAKCGQSIPDTAPMTLNLSNDLVRSAILITHPNMDAVWRRINNRNKKRINVQKEGLASQSGTGLSELSEPYMLAHDYYLIIIQALCEPNYWEKLSPSKRENEYNELIFDLQKTSATLLKVGFRDSPFDLMTTIERDRLEANVDGFIFKPLTSLLDRYAEKLKSEQRHMDTLVDRSNRQDNGLLYFIRYMEKHHTASFGRSLYEIISLIAGVFFPDQNTSIDKIRSSTR